jgi:putrescine---pyruvate transaminase
MTAAHSTDSSFWHPFADMGTVRHSELVIDRGEGVWVFDEDGRRYLDATASLWYANIGHGRREIADAVAAQLAKIESYSTFGDLANRPALELSERLTALAPMPSRVFLTSGGGDSIETAAKLARRYCYELGQGERTVILSRTAGYHGTHGFGTSIGGIDANRVGFGPQLESAQVAYDSVDALRDAIASIGADRVAAFFVEPVIGAGGVHPPPEGYIEGVAEVCRETGVLLVVDSVICGFGRLGTWYGIERWGVVPDMITFAKGVTSGYLPLGGVIVSDTVAEPFWGEPGSPVVRHGPTYAGHATCCAAALANIALLERDGLLERGRELEQPLVDALEPLTALPGVGEVRGGMGLMAAVELDADVFPDRGPAAAEVARLARAEGVLIRPLAAGLALSPPLIVEVDQLEMIAAAIAAAVEKYATSAAALQGSR